MPLYRHTKLPPPPELGEKTLWQYLPRNSGRRVLFLLIAFGAVLVLKHAGGWTFGGLLGGGAARRTASGAELPVYHLEVKLPGEPPGAKSPSLP
jgi:hypothetical protein